MWVCLAERRRGQQREKKWLQLPPAGKYPRATEEGRAKAKAKAENKEKSKEKQWERKKEEEEEGRRKKRKKKERSLSWNANSYILRTCAHALPSENEREGKKSTEEELELVTRKPRKTRETPKGVREGRGQSEKAWMHEKGLKTSKLQQQTSSRPSCLPCSRVLSTFCEELRWRGVVEGGLPLPPFCAGRE